jgi:D-amino-acid dehydrogenase
LKGARIKRFFGDAERDSRRRRVAGAKTMSKEAKTIGVIGAGIIGVAVASCLQRDGHEVFVVDPNEPGRGASFGNAGLFGTSSVVPMSMPGVIRHIPGWLSDPLGPLAVRWSYLPVIARWLARFVAAGRPERVERQARALRSMLGRAVDNLAPLVEAAEATAVFHRQGSLFVYRSLDSFRRDHRAWELRARNGVQWEELDAAGLRQFEPSLSSNCAHGILVRTNGHTSDPHSLVTRLAEYLVKHGATLYRTAATGFVLDGDRLCAIRTAQGDIPADAAVVAAGAFSRPLTAQLGDRVPLETERGYHIMIRDPEVRPRVPISDQEGKFMATPMETGLRLAGTVELAGLEAPPNWQRSRILLRRARLLFPALLDNYPEERLSLWMGHRPSLPDSLPVIDRSKRSPDVFYAFGHGHVGMASSGMTGIVLADLVAGRPPAIDLAPFRANRF